MCPPSWTVAVNGAAQYRPDGETPHCRFRIHGGFCMHWICLQWRWNVRIESDTFIHLENAILECASQQKNLSYWQAAPRFLQFVVTCQRNAERARLRSIKGITAQCVFPIKHITNWTHWRILKWNEPCTKLNFPTGTKCPLDSCCRGLVRYLGNTVCQDKKKDKQREV